MRGTLYLILGVISLFEFGYHIYSHNGEAGRLFGFEIPNLPFLAIWAILGVYFFYKYYSIRKTAVVKK